MKKPQMDVIQYTTDAFSVFTKAPNKISAIMKMQSPFNAFMELNFMDIG